MVNGRPVHMRRFELPVLAFAVALVLLSSSGDAKSAWGGFPEQCEGGASTVEAPEGEGEPERRGAVETEGEGAVQDGSVAEDVERVDRSSLVPELLQFPEMPAGCEVYSLSAVLAALGHEVDPHEVVARDLPFASPGGGVASAYQGDPYVAGSGLPPAIVFAGDSYLARAGSEERFADVTGAAFDELLARADEGSPVLVWTTTYLQDPGFGGPLAAYTFYYPEHCVVLLGSAADRVRVMDPMVGLTEYDRSWFARVYELCGSMAVEIAD